MITLFRENWVNNIKQKIILSKNKLLWLHSGHWLGYGCCLALLAFQTISPTLAAKRTKMTIHRVSLMQKFRLIISLVFLSASFAKFLISLFWSILLLMTYLCLDSSVPILFVVSSVYAATLWMFLILSFWSKTWRLISTSSLWRGSFGFNYSSIF